MVFIFLKGKTFLVSFVFLSLSLLMGKEKTFRLSMDGKLSQESEKAFFLSLSVLTLSVKADLDTMCTKNISMGCFVGEPVWPSGKALGW